MARCGACDLEVADYALVDHFEHDHPGSLRIVEDYAISPPGEEVTIERRHLERVPGEAELTWLVRMARNLGYVTTADIPPQGLGCVDCGLPLAPGFRRVERLTGFIGAMPRVEIICLPCGRADPRTTGPT